MPGARATIVALAGFICLYTAIADSASADWFVGGKKLATSAAIAGTAKLDTSVVLSTPTLGVKAQCSGGITEHSISLLELFSVVIYKKLVYHSCTVTQPASGCALEETPATLLTEPLEGRLSLGPGEADRAVFKPKSGTVIAVLKFLESNTCAFDSEEALKGAYILNLPNGQLELEAQAFEGLGSVENNSLEISAGNKTFIEAGRSLLKLASSSKWAFK